MKPSEIVVAIWLASFLENDSAAHTSRETCWRSVDLHPKNKRFGQQ